MNIIVILLTIIAVVLTCVVIIQVVRTKRVMKKESLLCLLTLSLYLHATGEMSGPLNAERFLWFVYDIGLMIWVFFAIEKKRRSNGV